jgi:hypothetical protein
VSRFINWGIVVSNRREEIIRKAAAQRLYWYPFSEYNWVRIVVAQECFPWDDMVSDATQEKITQRLLARKPWLHLPE